MPLFGFIFRFHLTTYLSRRNDLDDWIVVRILRLGLNQIFARSQSLLKGQLNDDFFYALDSLIAKSEMHIEEKESGGLFIISPILNVLQLGLEFRATDLVRCDSFPVWLPVMLNFQCRLGAIIELEIRLEIVVDGHYCLFLASC
jgi:hypothetical protein